MLAAAILEPTTALILAVAAVLTQAAIIVGYFKTKNRQKKGDERVEEIHVLVNSKMSDALARIDELEKELRVARDSTDEAQAQD